MDNLTKQLLTKTLQKELLRRKLILYFKEKGYDNFLVKPYPPSLCDIQDKVDILNSIIEVNNYLEDIEMQSGMIKVGWNIFLLGNNRAHLGLTSHSSMADVENSCNHVAQYQNGKLTIKQIIEWIVNTAGDSQNLFDEYQKNITNNKMIVPKSVAPSKTIPSFRKRV